MKNENFEYCKRIAEEIEAAHRCEALNEDGEEVTLYDYIADALDVEYIIDSRREYKAGRVFVTLGGPTVWVDTARRSVCLAWGAERAEYLLDIDAASAIDEILEEFYNC